MKHIEFETNPRGLWISHGAAMKFLTVSELEMLLDAVKSGREVKWKGHLTIEAMRALCGTVTS